MLLAGLMAAVSAAAEKKTRETLGGIVMHGVPPPLAQRLQEALGIKAGEELFEGLPRAAEQKTLFLLRDEGLMEASVRADLQADKTGNTLHLFIESGPPSYFGETRIEGLEKIPLFVVEREREYQAGDPYDRRKLLQTRSRLFLTGLFEEIRVDVSTTPARTVDVLIAVKERPLKKIKGGFGWGSEENQRVMVILTHDNMFRRAYKAEATARWTGLGLETRLDLVSRYFLKTRTQLRTSAGWRRENREGYDFERIAADATFGRALLPRLTASLGPMFNRTTTFRVNPQIAAVTPDLSDSRSLVAGLVWEGTDDPFFPSKGLRSEIRWERAGQKLGGTIHFNKAFLGAKIYQPLGKGWVAALAGRGGVARAIRPSTEVPIFDRFFIGGANSVRGYRERGVGPKDDRGSPLGGTWMSGASLEIRFPLYKQLMGAAFADGGVTALSRREARPPQWKHSAGGGLRLRTPVGPVRLDYGYKLNPDREDPDLWRLHLSLGESF
jgi:outer membrane protein assembly complex protein YaeT